MKNLYSLFSGLLIILMSSCQTPKESANTNLDNESLHMQTAKENQDITKIKFHKHGGMMGYDESIEITPFKVTYTYRDRNYHKPVVIEEPNTKNDWNSIIACVPIEDFKSLKEGESKLLYDGMDTEVTIIKADKTYHKRNVEGLDNKNNRADELYTLLHREVDKYRQKLGEKE